MESKDTHILRGQGWHFLCPGEALLCCRGQSHNCICVILGLPESTYVIWYLTHEYHILLEFHKPSIRKDWKNLSQDCKDFLEWFARLSFWKMQFHKEPDFIIVHLHRPIIAGQPEAFMEIHSQNNFSILEFEDYYSEAQRFIFAQNKIIPKEIWPAEGFNFNDHPEHEIYYERIKSAGNMHYYEITHNMNAQPPEDPRYEEFSLDDIDSEMKVLEIKRKHRTKDKSIWNKEIWREKRARAGMDRWQWATDKGISISDYSTESESVSDEDSITDEKFDGEWETFKRSQKRWDPSKWKGTRFKR